MSTQHTVPHCYRFADLRLDTGQLQVWRDDVPLPLPKLSFNMLLELIVEAPNVVSHDALATSVWGQSRVVTRIGYLRPMFGCRDGTFKPSFSSSIPSRARSCGYGATIETSARR